MHGWLTPSTRWPGQFLSCSDHFQASWCSRCATVAPKTLTHLEEVNSTPWSSEEYYNGGNQPGTRKMPILPHSLVESVRHSSTSSRWEDVQVEHPGARR